MELGETELVGPVDDDGVGGGYVDAAFDDGGADQDVVALVIEVEHHLLQLPLAHLSMGDADVGAGCQPTHLVGGALDAGDLVVQEVDLTAPLQFSLDRLGEQGVVPLGDEGLDRHPFGGWGGEVSAVCGFLLLCGVGALCFRAVCFGMCLWAWAVC